jgi:hypothetical protein
MVDGNIIVAEPPVELQQAIAAWRENLYLWGQNLRLKSG